MFKTIGIIGLGMIGGSVVRDIKRLELTDKIVASDLNDHSLKIALDNGWIDSIAANNHELSRKSDLIILAAPCQCYKAIFCDLAVSTKNTAIITDVASIKEQIINECNLYAPNLLDRYIPAHPITGSHKSGVVHAQEKLFHNAKVILTPSVQTDNKNYVAVAKFWQTLGSVVLKMEAQKHDHILSITSHLPHLLSFALLDSLGTQNNIHEILNCTAGSFDDFTRIAGSNSKIWSDIFRGNKQHIKNAVSQFKLSLDKLEQQLEEVDNGQLIATLENARKLKSGAI